MINSTNAMTVRVHFSFPTRYRKDADGQELMAQANNAHADDFFAGRKLWGNGSLNKLISQHQRMRKLVEAYSSPFADGGLRVMKNSAFPEFNTKWLEEESEFDKLKREFVANRDANVAADKVRLNGAFDAADYPSADDMARVISCRILFGEISNPEDWRLGDSIAPEIAAKIRQDATEEYRESIKASVKIQSQALVKALSSFAGILSSYDSKLAAEERTRLDNRPFETLIDALSRAPLLDLSDNPEFAQLCSSLKAEISNLEPEVIRVSSTARKQTIEKANGLAENTRQFLANLEGI